jgi:sugar lactone lactonase YvrE
MKRFLRVFASACVLAGVAASPAAAKPGDLLVTDYDAGKVLRIDPRNGAQSVLATSPLLEDSGDLALMPSGTILVTQESSENAGVMSVSPNGTVTQIAGAANGLEDPYGAGLAPNGRLIFTDYGVSPDGALFSMGAAGGTPQTLLAGPPLDDVLGLDVARDGTIYLGDDNAPGGVFKLAPGASTAVPVATGNLLEEAFEVHVEARGTLLASNIQEDSIVRVDPGTGAQQSVADLSPAQPIGIDTAPDGTIYVADYQGLGSVIRIAPSGAFSAVASGGNIEGPGNLLVEPPKCGGKFPTIQGSNAKEKLRGTKGPDVIVAYGGKDTILGLGGKDLLCGGAGRDVISGGGGKDRLFGQGGADALRGGKGKDKLVGGAGKDRQRQ